MQHIFCTAKLHRITVTGADIDYQGSITIDEDVVEKAGLRAGQIVQINNLANGTPWRTYIVPGERGKGEVILNGPPAHHFKRGDKVIVYAEAWVTDEEVEKLGLVRGPRVVFFEEKGETPNSVSSIKEGWTAK